MLLGSTRPIILVLLALGLSNCSVYCLVVYMPSRNCNDNFNIDVLGELDLVFTGNSRQECFVTVTRTHYYKEELCVQPIIFNVVKLDVSLHLYHSGYNKYQADEVYDYRRPFVETWCSDFSRIVLVFKSEFSATQIKVRVSKTKKQEPSTQKPEKQDVFPVATVLGVIGGAVLIVVVMVLAWCRLKAVLSRGESVPPTTQAGDRRTEPLCNFSDDRMMLPRQLEENCTPDRQPYRSEQTRQPENFSNWNAVESTVAPRPAPGQTGMYTGPLEPTAPPRPSQQAHLQTDGYRAEPSPVVRGEVLLPPTYEEVISERLTVNLPPSSNNAGFYAVSQTPQQQPDGAPPAYPGF